MANSYEVAQLYASMTLKGMGTVKAELTALQKSVFNLRNAFGLLKDGMTALVETGAKFENYRKRLEAVAESAQEASDVFKRMSEWASVNPVDTDDAIAAFVRLRTAAVANTEEATRQLGNLSAVMGVTMEDAANVLVSLNSRALRNVGIQLDQTGKKAKISIRGITTEVEKNTQAIQEGIIKTVSRAFNGQMEAMKNTWRGTVNTLGGMWGEFKRQVAGDAGSGGPFDLLKDILITIRREWEAFTKSSDYPKFIKGIQDGINKVIVASLRAFATVTDAMGNLIGYVEKYASSMEYGLLGKLVFGTKGLVIGAALGWVKDQVWDPVEEGLTAAQKETYTKLKNEVTLRKGLIAGRKSGDDPNGTDTGDLEVELAKAEKDLEEFKNKVVKSTFSNTLKSFSGGLTRLANFEELKSSQRGRLVDGEDSYISGGSGSGSTARRVDPEKAREERLKQVKKAIEAVTDSVKYGESNLSDYLGMVNRLLEQTPQEFERTFNEEWKAYKDLQMEILDQIKADAKQKQEEILAQEDWRYEQGLTNVKEYFTSLQQRYREGLEKIRVLEAKTIKTKKDKDELASLYGQNRSNSSAVYSAATAAMEEMNTKISEGRMTLAEARVEAEGYLAALKELGFGIPKELQKLADGFDVDKSFLKELQEQSKNWCTTLQEGITDAIVECNSLSDVLANVGKQMEKFALNWMLFGKNGEGGLFGKMFSGIFSAIGGHHSGGIIGSDAATFTRYLPRFHTGGIIGSDEELAVLRKGEGVFTEAQMKALGGVGGGVNVNVTVNNTGTGSMTDEQAQAWGKTLKSAVTLQVQKELYKYKRQGYAF